MTKRRRQRLGLLVAVMTATSACAQAAVPPPPTSSSSEPTTISTSSAPSSTPSTAPATTDPRAATPPSVYTTPSIPPIEGYGDFSQIPYTEIDWTEVNTLVVRCLQDNGVPARLIPPGDGFEIPMLPEPQATAADSLADACMEGLRIPPYQQYSAEELAVLYDELLETKACLEEHGYDIDPPPSKQTFVESYYTDPWNPYVSLPDVSPAEWDKLQEDCPQP